MHMFIVGQVGGDVELKEELCCDGLLTWELALVLCGEVWWLWWYCILLMVSDWYANSHHYVVYQNLGCGKCCSGCFLLCWCFLKHSWWRIGWCKVVRCLLSCCGKFVEWGGGKWIGKVWIVGDISPINGGAFWSNGYNLRVYSTHAGSFTILLLILIIF